MPPPLNDFTRAVCIVDTCSIINLDEIILARQDVLYYMRRYFDVHVCAAIRDEFDRHKDLVSSREASYWSSFLSKKRYSPMVLIDDKTVLGPFYSTPPSFAGTDNAGEHGNARVALELLVTRTVGHTIFVTDDETAWNAFLKVLRRSFPGVHLWTSADVILHLGAALLREKKADFDSIRSALRDVYAATARKWEEITHAEKSAIIRKQKASVDSLRLLKQVVDHWRK